MCIINENEIEIEIEIDAYKKCVKCKVIKKITEYHKRSESKDGLINTCKVCKREYRKEYQKNNKKLLIDKAKAYYIENKEAIDESNRSYYIRNKTSIVKRQKAYYDNNRKNIAKRQKVYYENNRECINEKAKSRRKDNPEIEANYRRLNKYKSPHIEAWRGILKSALKRMHSKKLENTIDMLGYNPDDLKIHMEYLFTECMSWDNHGEWHIDHKIPLSAFNKDTPMCIVNSLENLQPLWSKDNLYKSDKIFEEFKTMDIYIKYCKL